MNKGIKVLQDENEEKEKLNGIIIKWVLVIMKGAEKMEILKNINMYNLIKILIILLMLILAPIILINKSIKKYVQCPLAKLIKTFNV